MSELPHTEIFNTERLQTSVVVRTVSIASHIQEQFFEAHKNKIKYYKHHASDAVYQLVGFCLMQVNSQYDMAYSVIYQNIETGAVWCRPKTEFDARFKEVFRDPENGSYIEPNFTTFVNREGDVL